MITPNSFGFDVSCDGCSHQDFLEADSWSELMELMKEEGWTFAHVGAGEFEHKCACCDEEPDGGGMPAEAW